jgi:hypothetical protein
MAEANASHRTPRAMAIGAVRALQPRVEQEGIYGYMDIYIYIYVHTIDISREE